MKYPIKTPFTAPTMVPTAMAVPIPSGTLSVCAMTSPEITALALMTVEIDRSIPPVRKTNVIPMAAIRTTAFAPSMASILPDVRKYGENSENATASAAMIGIAG